MYRVAMERTKLKVKPEKFQIYDLTVREEMSSLEVARLLRVNITRVYAAKHRVGRILKQEIEILRREIDAMEKNQTHRVR